MDIYFDESRNTGEIGINGSKLNYFEQRYFILVGYINDDLITKKYEKFKKENIRKLYPDSVETEIKGTDLLKRENNEILDEFIKTFIKENNLLITIYDKKFFIVTSLLVWLFGIPLRDKEPISFYRFCEFLIKVDDQFLVNFIYVSNNNTIDNIKKFIEFTLDYSFDECITTSFEHQIREEFIMGINSFMELGDEYFEILQEDIVFESVKITGRNRNNIVNLTALGETILLLKLNRDVINERINIFHDNIEIIEEYINHYLKDVSIEFLDSKKHLQIQLADNVSSIIGKFINNILPMLNDGSLKSALSDDNKWIRTRLSKILDSMNQNNIKMVVQLREQAFLKTFCSTSINALIPFKLEFQKNLDLRFELELSNHITIKQTSDLFKK